MSVFVSIRVFLSRVCLPVSVHVCHRDVAMGVADTVSLGPT